MDKATRPPPENPIPRPPCKIGLTRSNASTATTTYGKASYKIFFNDPEFARLRISCTLYGQTIHALFKKLGQGFMAAVKHDFCVFFSSPSKSNPAGSSKSSSSGGSSSHHHNPGNKQQLNVGGRADFVRTEAKIDNKASANQLIIGGVGDEPRRRSYCPGYHHTHHGQGEFLTLFVLLMFANPE